MKIENVLTAEYTFTDEPLDVSEVDGLMDAIKETAQDKESRLVEAESRVTDYKTYWNSKTDTVRVGAVVIGASYEVPQEKTEKYNEQ